MLRRSAMLLALATLALGLLEAGVALAIGLASSSPALEGLGLESGIKAVAAIVVVWELTGRRDARQEGRALRLLALGFFAVAGYVTASSTTHLASSHAPDATTIGVGAAAVGVVAFPLLATIKRRIGRSLGSAVVLSDANKTQLYGWLCLAVLMGSGLNLWLGWWWADPIAGLAVAALAVREGAQDWREAATIDDRNRGE